MSISIRTLNLMKKINYVGDLYVYKLQFRNIYQHLQPSVLFKNFRVAHNRYANLTCIITHVESASCI